MLPFGSIVPGDCLWIPNDCVTCAKTTTRRSSRSRICSICTAACTYESGEREIPVWALIKLADYYRVSTDYLLGLTDDPARR